MVLFKKKKKQVDAKQNQGANTKNKCSDCASEKDKRSGGAREVKGGTKREVNFKQELYFSDPDSPTTILDADSDTTSLALDDPALDAQDALNGEPSHEDEGAQNAEPMLDAQEILNAEPPGTTVLNIADVRHITSVEECESALNLKEDGDEVDATCGADTEDEGDSKPCMSANAIDERGAEACEQASDAIVDAVDKAGTIEEGMSVGDSSEKADGITCENATTAPPKVDACAVEPVETDPAPVPEILLTRKKTGEIFDITRDTTTVGKSKYSDVQIKNTQTVSRNHVTLQKREDRLFVQDEKSLNGTFINNERMRAGSSCEVFDGDIVRLSDEELIVSIKQEQR